MNQENVNQLRLHRRAEATLDKLGEEEAAVVVTSLERLESFGVGGKIDPNVRKLTAGEPLFVMRAGKMFRIIFRRLDSRTLEVLEIVRRDRLVKMFPESAGAR